MTVQTEGQRLPALAMLAMFAISAVQTAEANEAGKVIFAKGPVSAEREPPVPLAKGDAVLTADTVVTGEAARAQLLMLDGAKVAIRPNSRLLIEEFLFPSGEVAEDGMQVASASGDRAVFRLIKGGFRSITGAIGKHKEDEYVVRTPVGVLGIRGTDYTVVLCQADCDSAPEPSGSPMQDGLHVSVASGIVVFSNEFGDIEVMAGSSIVIPFADRRPQRVVAPDGSGGEDSEDAEEEPTDEETPETPDIVTDPDGNEINITDPNPPPGNRTISWSSGPLEPTFFAGFTGTEDSTPDQYVLDAANNVEGFFGAYPTMYPTSFNPPPLTGTPEATFGIGTATNVDTGFDPVTMLRWGRWSGGTANITLDDGSDASQDLSTQSLHWISSPEWMTPPVLPLSGAVEYSLIGNTSPTNNFGEVGVLGSASFVADFTNMQVFSTLDLAIGGVNWVASGTGIIGFAAQLPAANHFFGIYNNVSNFGSGIFSGFFSEPGNTSDPNVPGGVGLIYTLTDSDFVEWVSGSLAFGDPVPAPPGNRTISWSTAHVSDLIAGAFSGVQDNAPGDYILDSGDNLVGFDGPYPTGFFLPPRGTPPVQAMFALGSSANTDTGFDAVTMLRWGRWSGGIASITREDGVDVSQDLSTQSLHWVSSPEWFAPPVLPLTGSFTYSLVGNTSPTDNFGNVGVLGSASFFADFTNMLVLNDLFLTIGGSTWNANGSGDIGAGAGLPGHQFLGAYGLITITDSTGGTTTSNEGYFSGFFSDPGNTPDLNLPGGVGMTYVLTDQNGGDGGVVVSGALVFGDPVPAPVAQ